MKTLSRPRRNIILLCTVFVGVIRMGHCAPKNPEAWPPPSPGDVEEINLGVGYPEKGLSPDDKTFVSSENIGVDGQTSYITGVDREGVRRWIFVFRRCRNGENGGFSVENTSYLSATSNFLGNPQISPDGNKLLFQVGDLLSSHALYNVCYWDFAKQKITISPVLLNYPQARWSPDSNYIGYFVGGDKYGGWDEPQYAPRICVENVQTGKQNIVSQQGGITSWGWTTTGSVLFTQFSQKPTPLNSLSGDVNRDSEVLEYDPKTGKTTSLIQHASQPVASRDDQWIAFTQFVSKPHEPKPEADAVETPTFERYCAIYDRKTHRTFQIGNALDYDAQDSVDYAWNSKSGKLLSLQTSVIPGSQPVNHRCTIRSFDISALNAAPKTPLLWGTISHFYYRNRADDSRVEITPRVVTQDGTYLVCNIHDLNSTNNGSTNEIIEAVNIANGQSHILASKEAGFDQSLGLDWFELPR